VTQAASRANGPSGLLLVDKPEGLTSHDVVDVARRLLGTRRIGHSGTLDPAATGLLVLCVGRAGRLQSFLTGFDKTYEGEMLLGIATDTYDREGTPVGPAHPDPHPSPEALAEVCRRYAGLLEQAPPPFSAKKIAGKKFYELARRGEAVPHLPKSVTVHRLEVLGLEGARARFVVACSSGTYIRSLVHDIGQDLGMGAHITALRRTTVGPFHLEEARTLDALEALGPEERTARPFWIPLSEVPLPYPAVPLLPGEAAKVRRGHGVAVRPPAEAIGAPWVRLVSGNEIVALGHLEPLGRGALALAKPKIVLQD
jgi:tRNA pseudouridine55 synthase